MDPLSEIKRLYYQTTRATIANDLARAVALLKSMPTEAERERAAVYLDGLSQMRSEWGVSGSASRPPKSRSAGRRRPRR